MTVPAEGEGTLLGFYKKMAEELPEDAKDALNHCARSLIERGWLPALPQVANSLAEEISKERVKKALMELIQRRLLRLAGDGKRIEGILGTIATARTDHRGLLSAEVTLYTFGGMDLLALNPMLGKPVDIFSKCGQCQADIKMRIEDGAVVEAEPTGVAGFQANWDGTSRLQTVSENSPLFCGDDCLDKWTDEHKDVDGLPLSGDLLLFIGMGMAQECGAARFSMISF